MTDADVRKRCEEIANGWTLNGPGGNYVDYLYYLYRAAYADGQRAGMERARKIASKYIMMPHIAEEIRQAAGEVTGG